MPGIAMKGITDTTSALLISSFVALAILVSLLNLLNQFTQATDVVADDLDLLNAVDCAHLIEACMKDSSGHVTEESLRGFRIDNCFRRFPGLAALDFEYMVWDTESSLQARSQGYDSVQFKTSHYIFIPIAMSSGEIDVGRIHVKIEKSG